MNTGETQPSDQNQAGLVHRASQKLSAALHWYFHDNNEQAEPLDPEATYQAAEEGLRQRWLESLPEEATAKKEAWQLEELAREVGPEAMLAAFVPENSALWTSDNGRRIKTCVIEWVSQTLAVASVEHRILEDRENLIVASLLDRLGLGRTDGSAIVNTWLTFDTDQEVHRYEEVGLAADPAHEAARGFLNNVLKENLMSISWIEDLQPGAASMLYSQFGIRNFRRYAPANLVDQLTMKRDPAQPLNVVISDTDDNNAFFGVDQYAGITRLLHDGQTVYAEARYGSAAMLYAYAAGMARQFGPIDRLVFCAHGTELTVGNDPDQSVTRSEIEDARYLASMKTEGTVSQNAIAAFIGCSTGAEDGIATTFARKIGVPTFAFPDMLLGFDLNPNPDYPAQSVRLAQSLDGEQSGSVLILPDGTRHVIGSVLQPLSSYTAYTN